MPASPAGIAPEPGAVRFRVVPASYVYLLRTSPGAVEVLLNLRQGTGYRDGYWAAATAGHVERGESALAAACREAAEELAITLAPADLVPLTTMHRTGATGDPIDERVDFFFTCRRWVGEPRIAEPGKSARLEWFPLSALPQPTVPHEREVLSALAAGTPLPAIVTHGFPTS